MTSALHQITMSYSTEDDRMLLRVSTTDKTEYRLWLTRRFVRVLWGALIQVLEREPSLKKGLTPKVKKAVVAMQHHEAVSAADFSRGHDEGYDDLTSNTGPQLVVGGSVTPGDKGLTGLRLKTRDGRDFNFALNKNLLHAL